jgi:hypothetical protein
MRSHDAIAFESIGVQTNLVIAAANVGVNTTQNEIISIAKGLGAVDDWQLTHCRTEDQVAEAFKR